MRANLTYTILFLVFGLPLCFKVVPGEWSVNRRSPEAIASERLLVSKENNLPVRIAVYSGEGAFFRSITASMAMFQWMGAEAQRIDPQEIVEGKLEDFDVLYMTGGWAVPYKRDLGGEGVKRIRSFLEAGGGYIGICAGAFFAADYIFWEGERYEYPLDIFPGYAKGSIKEIAPWPQYTMCRINLSGGMHPITAGEPPSLMSMYYGAPWFSIPPGAKIDTLATYDVNGEPAMVAYPYGKGRVFLSGVHTEFEEGNDRDGVLWDDALHDPESEWPLMLAAVKWTIRGR
ncbi:MAG: hypothetical protein GTN81_13560 [Proteobacteria bacterium]|nr:hypothetical protein [Pseudomonadota bacterium]